MKKIVLSVIVLLILTGGAYFLMSQKKATGPIQTHVADLTKEDAVAELNDFLDYHDERFVILSLTLDGKMTKQLADGMLRSPTIPFDAKDPDDDTKTIYYVLRLREDGVREFVFDETTGKFEGVFKTYKQQSIDGKTFINLVAISPAEYKEYLEKVK